MVCCRFLLTFTLITVSVLTAAGQGQPGARELQGDSLPTGAVARLGFVRWRHDDVVAFAAFLPDGKSVISVGADRAIRIWEFPSGKELRAISVAPDVKDGKDAKSVFIVPANSGLPEIAAALSHDGKTIATWFGRKPTAAQILRKVKGDGPQLPPIHLHDVATGKELPALKIDGLWVATLLFSPTGKQLTSVDVQGAVSVWDLAAAKLVRTIAAAEGETPTAKMAGFGSRGAAESKYAYSPDGKTLLAYGATRVIQVLDLQTGKRTGEGAFAALTAVYFSSDSKQLFTQAADGSMRQWDARTGKDLGSINLVWPNASMLGSSLALSGTNHCVSHDGQIAVSYQRKALGKDLIPLVGPGASASSEPLTHPRVAVSPDGKSLAFAGQDRLIHVWDVASGAELAAFKGHTAEVKAVAFAPDGKLLASASDDSTALVWDMTRLDRPSAPKKALQAAEMTAAARAALSTAFFSLSLASSGWRSTYS